MLSLNPEGNGKVYKNAVHCLKTIVKTEGVQGLYRGLVPTVLKSFVGTGITFAIYNGTKSWLEGKYDDALI